MNLDRPEKQGLEALFTPEAVAVIGATDRPARWAEPCCKTCLHLLSTDGVPGQSAAREVLGVKAYKSIGEVPEPVDLVVLATPAVTIPGADRRMCRGQSEICRGDLRRIQRARSGRNRPGDGRFRSSCGTARCV